MTDQEWTAALLALAAGWPDQELLVDDITDAWRGMLDVFPGELVLAAVKSYIADGERFRPNVGMLLKRAHEFSTERIPDFADAWAEILRVARSSSWSTAAAEVRWSNPLIGLTAARIGLRTVMNAHEGDAALRAHARTTYETLARRAEEEHRYAVAGIDLPRLPAPNAALAANAMALISRGNGEETP